MSNKFFKRIKAPLLNRKNLQWIPVYWILVFFIIPIILLSVLHFFYLKTNLNFLSFRFNLSNLFSVFENDNLIYFKNSFNLAFATSFVTTIVGFILAFFVYFMRTSFRNYLIVLICLPYIINPTVQFYSINSIFSTSGFLNNFLVSNNIISEPIAVSNFIIGVIVLSYKLLPVVFFILTVMLKKTDPSQLEAAIDLGLSRTRLFFSFICKKSIIGLFASFIFVFILTFGNFSSVINFSFYDLLFSSKILNGIDFTSGANSDVLSVSSNLFVFGVITVLVLISYKIYSDKNTDFDAEFLGERISKYKCYNIGKSFFSFGIVFPLILFLHIVLLYVFVFSFNSTNSLVNFENFSLKWYEALITNYKLVAAFKNSFIIAAFSALVSTLLGAMISLSFSKYNELLNLKFTRIIRLTLIVSEIFFISGITFILKLFRLNETNYLSVIIAISVVGILLASLLIHSKIKEIDLNMESASLDLGADYTQTFKRIFLPVVLPTICSCFLIIFVFSINEFALSYAVHNHQIPILAAELLEQTNSPSPLLNATASVLIFISLVFISVANIFSFYKEKTKNIKFVLILLIFILAILFCIW